MNRTTYKVCLIALWLVAAVAFYAMGEKWGAGFLLGAAFVTLMLV
jgi:hypothetical protein